MDNTHTQDISPDSNLSGWKKYIIYGIIGIITSLGIGYIGFSGYQNYQKYYQTISHPSFGSEESMEWMLSTAKEGNVTPQYLRNLWLSFYQSTNKGDFYYALKILNEAVVVTHGNSSITGKKYISESAFLGLAANTEKANNEKDRRIKSELYFQNGEIEYEIGNKLYFDDEKEHATAILYHYFRAIEEYDKSIREYDNAKAHRQKGVVLLDLGEGALEKAISELEIAIQIDETDAVNFYKLGNAYNNDNQYEKAIETYLKGLAIYPSHELMQVNLAITYKENKNTPESMRVIKKYLESCQEYCNLGYYDLGNWLSETEGWSANTINTYEKAIESGKKKGEIYRNAYRILGQYYFEKGIISAWNKEKEILALCEKYLLISINDPSDKATHINMFNQNTYEAETFYLLGKLYMHRNDSENARKYIEMGLRRYPKDEDLLSIQKEYQKKYPSKQKIGIL